MAVLSRNNNHTPNQPTPKWFHVCRPTFDRPSIKALILTGTPHWFYVCRPTFEEILLELQRLWQLHQSGSSAVAQKFKMLQPPATAQLLQALYPGNDAGAAWQVCALH